MSQLSAKGEPPTLPSHSSVDSAPRAAGEKPMVSFGPRDWAAVACAAGACALVVHGGRWSRVLVHVRPCRWGRLLGGGPRLLCLRACAARTGGHGIRVGRPPCSRRWSCSPACPLRRAIPTCAPATPSCSPRRACSSISCSRDAPMTSPCARPASRAHSASSFARSSRASLIRCVPSRAWVMAGHARIGPALLSVLAALALLCVVLPLLARADVTFDRVLGRVLARLGGGFETNFMRVARFAFVALVTSSLLVSLLRGGWGACGAAEGESCACGERGVGASGTRNP